MKKYLFFLLTCTIAGSALAEPGYVAMRNEWPVVGKIFDNSYSMYTLYSNRKCKLNLINAEHMRYYEFNPSESDISGCWLNTFGEDIAFFYNLENKELNLKLGRSKTLGKLSFIKAEIYSNGSFKVLSDPLKNPFP